MPDVKVRPFRSTGFIIFLLLLLLLFILIKYDCRSALSIVCLRVFLQGLLFKPISQLTPLYPATQVHVYLLSPSSHVPPF